MSVNKFIFSLVFAAVIALGVVALGGIGGLRFDFAGQHQAVAAGSSHDIDAEIAKLGVKPRTVELISEKAMRVQTAIKQGDYATAQKTVVDMIAQSHLENWRYYPFSDFVGGIADLADPTFETKLNAWVAQNSKSAIPLLIRAQFYWDRGWFIRGSRFTNLIQSSKMASFADCMTKAFADIDAAIQLDEKIPYSYYLKLRIIGSGGSSEAVQQFFREAIAKYPGYYALYDTMLRFTEPKWGGSIPAMYTLVDEYAGKAEPNSPLKFLYLSLYRDLLDTASIACLSYSPDKKGGCVATAMQGLVKPELEAKVVAALELFDHTDHYQFGLAVEAILFDMFKTSGGDVYAGALLEQAAHSMHSDTQLKEETPGHNHYMIDEAVAESWYVKGFYDNAISKYQEAVKDLDTAMLPDEETRLLTLGRIYGNLAEIYNRLNDYEKMIVYEKAAIGLSGKTGEEHFICYAYYKLKNYDEAVKACTTVVASDGRNLKAFYWRGQAYRDSGKPDAALQDLTMVAESEDDFRASAAIDMSMIYFNRNDIQNALRVLNRYKYLYDSRTTSNSSIAVSYNNRCYAYMKLDQLTKALDDCNQSLKYGSLPDAIRKRAELVRRINAHEGPL